MAQYNDRERQATGLLPALQESEAVKPSGPTTYADACEALRQQGRSDERRRIRRAQRQALDVLRARSLSSTSDRDYDHLLDAIDNATKSPRRER